MPKSTEERVGIVETEVDTLKKSDDDQWTAINELRRFMHKLVPIWVTIVLMAMSFLTGGALTFASLIMRMNNKG